MTAQRWPTLANSSHRRETAERLPQPAAASSTAVDRSRWPGVGDPANYAPLVKACVDGIVDAGVVPDDDPDHVDPVQPVLFHPPETRWRWWLEVTEVTGQEAA